MEFFHRLGLFMEAGGLNSLLILLAGAVLLVIAVERILFLFFYLSINTGESMNSIKDMVLNRQYAQAAQLCQQQESYPELAVILSCIVNVDSGREAMRSALSEAVIRVSQSCERRLAFLALIASGATMLGLLGTISGLIKTFSGIATSDAGEKAKLLGLGIAEAMNSTAAGLIIGVLAMVFHTLCAARADRIVGKAQAAGLGLWTWIEQAERVPWHG